MRTNNTIAILGALTGLLMGCGDCYEACQLDADLYVKCNDGMNKSMLCFDDETEAPTRPCWSRAAVVESCENMQEYMTGIHGDQFPNECWSTHGHGQHDTEGLRDALRDGDCCAATSIYLWGDPDAYEDPDDCGTLGEW